MKNGKIEKLKTQQLKTRFVGLRFRDQGSSFEITSDLFSCRDEVGRSRFVRRCAYDLFRRSKKKKRSCPECDRTSSRLYLNCTDYNPSYSPVPLSVCSSDSHCTSHQATSSVQSFTGQHLWTPRPMGRPSAESLSVSVSLRPPYNQSIIQRTIITGAFLQRLGQILQSSKCRC